MKLSIAIPSKNRHKLLAGLLENLNKNVSIEKEVIVAYADSDTNTKKLLETISWVTPVLDGNRGAVVAYNSAMKITTGEYVCSMSDDARIVGDSFEIAIDYLDTHSE